MTDEACRRQDLLTAQFETVAALAALTGEYHRLLQVLGAAGFARQMAEGGPPGPLEEAELEEARAEAAAEACNQGIEDLEMKLDSILRELDALR